MTINFFLRDKGGDNEAPFAEPAELLVSAVFDVLESIATIAVVAVAAVVAELLVVLVTRLVLRAPPKPLALALPGALPILLKAEGELESMVLCMCNGTVVVFLVEEDKDDEGIAVS